MHYSDAFFYCGTCELHSACRVARRCAHKPQLAGDDAMAATTTSTIWLRLLVQARNRSEALTTEEAHQLAQVSPSPTVLKGMAERGSIVQTATAPQRYYVDGTCQVPSKITLDQLTAALAKRREWRTT